MEVPFCQRLVNEVSSKLRRCHRTRGGIPFQWLWFEMVGSHKSFTTMQSFVVSLRSLTRHWDLWTILGLSMFYPGELALQVAFVGLDFFGRNPGLAWVSWQRITATHHCSHHRQWKLLGGMVWIFQRHQPKKCRFLTVHFIRYAGRDFSGQPILSLTLSIPTSKQTKIA